MRATGVVIASAGAACLAIGAKGQLRTWVGPELGPWNQGSNWNPALVPDSIAEWASLPGGSGRARMSAGAVSISGLSIGPAAGVNIGPGGTLSVHTAHGGVVNNGEILINDAGTPGAAALVLTGFSPHIAGAGSITLNAHPSDLAGAVLAYYGQEDSAVIDAGQLITGRGVITSRFQNKGTIRAQGPGSEIAVYSDSYSSNSGVVEAVQGGDVSVDGSVLYSNAGGVIRADTGGTAHVTGLVKLGSLQASNGGKIVLGPDANLFEVAATGELECPAGSANFFQHALTLDGTLMINPSGAIVPATLTGRSQQADHVNSRIDGTGTVRLNAHPDSPASARLENDDRFVNLTHIGEGVSVRGTGEVKGDFENLGTIAADVPGRTLTVRGAMLSAGTISAVSGATILLDRLDLAQDAGAIIGGDGSTVECADSIITGGVVTIPPGGALVARGVCWLFGVRSSGEIRLEPGAILGLHGARHAGPVRVNDPSQGAPAQLNLGDDAAALAGSTVTLVAGPDDPELAILANPDGGNPRTLRADCKIAGTGTLAGAWRIDGVISPDGPLSTSDVGLIVTTYATELGPTAVIEMDIGGDAGGAFDRIVLGGAMTLGGRLSLRAAPGYVPDVGTTYDIIAKGSAQGSPLGQFDDVTAHHPHNRKFRVEYVPGAVRVVTDEGCSADFNGDGFVTGDDFDSFVPVFESGGPGADYNGDGFVTGDDFDGFIADFETGC